MLTLLQSTRCEAKSFSCRIGEQFTVNYRLNTLESIQFPHAHAHPGYLARSGSPEPKKAMRDLR
jgi:hypothetical protein